MLLGLRGFWGEDEAWGGCLWMTGEWWIGVCFNAFNGQENFNLSDGENFENHIIKLDGSKDHYVCNQ